MLGSRLTGLKPGVQLHIVTGAKPRNYDQQADKVRVRIFRALADNRPSAGFVDAGGFSDFTSSPRVQQFLTS